MCKFTEKINEDQYLKCLEYAGIIIVIIQDMTIQYYNPKLVDFFGYNVEEILEDHFLKRFICTGKSYDKVKEICKKRVDGYLDEEKCTIECNHKTDQLLVLDVVSYGVLWNDKPASLVFFWDVTQEKKLELDQLHYKYIFENSPRAIDICKLDGTIVEMNKKSEELWGLDRNDFINKENFFDLERIKNNPNLFGRVHVSLVSRTTQVLECYQTYNNTLSPKYVQTTIYPVITPEDTISHFVILNDDLSKKKRVEEEKEALYQDLIKKNSILETLSQVSRLLLDCKDPENLNEILQVVGEVLMVSRSYIFEILPPENKIFYRYEWVNNKVDSHINNKNLSNVTLKEIGFERWEALFNINSPVVIDDVENIPLSEQNLLKQQNIKSLLAIPIYLPNNKLYGFIGFDECRFKKVWSDSEKSILKNLANLVGSFIKKCHNERRLDKFVQDQSIILNNLDSYVWFFRDINTYGFINEKYYNDFICRPDLPTKSLFKDDCLIEECHIKEESLEHIQTNNTVFEIKASLQYNQWMTDTRNNHRLLSIKKLPVIEDDEVKYIVCIATDITEQYHKEKEIISLFKTQFDKDMSEIDQNLLSINKNLNDSKKIISFLEA